MIRFALAALTLGYSASLVAAQPTTAKAIQDRIASTLEPGAKIVPADLGRKPLERPVLDRLAFPHAAIPGSPVPAPRPPLIPRKPTPPSATREGMPLADSRTEPTIPAPIVLPEQPLVRVPSMEMERPLPIAILSVQVRDRTAVTDPSLDASVAAALAPQTPIRTERVPFSPLNLPDPFELSTQVRLRIAVDESTQPPAIYVVPPASR